MSISRMVVRREKGNLPNIGTALDKISRNISRVSRPVDVQFS